MKVRLRELALCLVVLIGGMTGITGSGYPPSTTDDLGPITGSAGFHTIEYAGRANVSSNNGSLVMDGPGRLMVDVPLVDAKLYEVTFVDVEVMEPVRVFDFHGGRATNSTSRFTDARITIQGTPTGLIQTWATDNTRTIMDLEMVPLPTSKIHASKTGAFLSSPDGLYVRDAPAPTFGFSHKGSIIDKGYFPDMMLSAEEFDHFSGSGDFMLLVEDSNVVIEHEDGREEIFLRTERTTDANVDVVRLTYLAVPVKSGTLNATFGDTKAVFLTQEHHMSLVGEASISNVTGDLSLNNVTSTVDDQLVDLRGNVSFNLSTYGESDGRSHVGPVQSQGTPSLVPEPESEMQVNSEDAEVKVDGEHLGLESAMEVTSYQTEATLIAKLMGTLFIVWVLVRSGPVLMGALVTREPFANRRRREIRDVVLRKGMVHVRGLQRITGISLGTLVYHLGILQRHGLIQSVSRSGYKVYFVPSPEFSRSEMERLSLLADPTRRSICDTLVRVGESSQSELAVLLRRSHSQAAKQLMVLEDCGIVDRKGRRNIRYSLSELTRRWLETNSHTR